MNHHRLILRGIIFISLLIYPSINHSDSEVTKLLFKPKAGKNCHLTNSKNTCELSLNPQLKLKTNSTTDFGSLTFKSTTQLFKVKGIHVTSWVAGSKIQFEKIINLIRETELNTVVIDIKEVDGIIGYEVNVKLAREVKAIQRRIKDIDEIIALCDKYGIYKIARITVFKDNRLATQRPYLAVLTKSGELWRDSKGQSWVNPYLRDVWEYNIAIAKDAVSRGFDEIQFDYVRFPSDGNIESCWYGPGHSMQKAAKAIIEFLKFAKQELSTSAFLSIDVFGLTTTCKNGIGIGQKFKEIAEYVDFISPMVYPSHYAKGAYGLSNPDSQPYKTVFFSLMDANKQIGNTKCRIRPWLQDFSLGYYYGASEVREQIKAVYAQGLDEWLLWNPKCRYTKSALLGKDGMKFVKHTLPKQTPDSKINTSPFPTETLPLSYEYDPNTFSLEPVIILGDKFEISKESTTISSDIKKANSLSTYSRNFLLEKQQLNNNVKGWNSLDNKNGEKSQENKQAVPPLKLQFSMIRLQ
ncbi:MAG: putative glycoside hydrolase [bacterium]